MSDEAKLQQKLYRPTALGARWGLSGSTIRRLMHEGKLPAPVRLSPRIFGWTLETIQAIEANKAAGKTAKGAK